MSDPSPEAVVRTLDFIEGNSRAFMAEHEERARTDPVFADALTMLSDTTLALRAVSMQLAAHNNRPIEVWRHDCPECGYLVYDEVNLTDEEGPECADCEVGVYEVTAYTRAAIHTARETDA